MSQMNTSKPLGEHQRESWGAVVRHRNEVSEEFSHAALVPSNISIKHGHMFPCHLQKKEQGKDGRGTSAPGWN